MRRMTDAEFNAEYEKRLNAAMARMVEHPREIVVLPMHPSTIGQALAAKKRSAKAAASSSAPAPAPRPTASASPYAAAEQARCKTILTSPEGKANPELAKQLAFKTDLSAEAALASLKEARDYSGSEVPGVSMSESMKRVLNGDRLPISASFREYRNELPDPPAGSMADNMRKLLAQVGLA